MFRTTLQDGGMPLWREETVLPKTNDLPRVIQLGSWQSQELIPGLSARLSPMYLLSTILPLDLVAVCVAFDLSYVAFQH